MRIAQLANFVTPTSGGIRTTLLALAAGYRAAGHERVLILPGRRDERVRDAAGLVVWLAAFPIPCSGGYRLLVNPRRVLGVLEELQPDVVEVSDRSTLLPVGPWVRARGIPALAIAHERADALLARRLPAMVPSGRLAAANARALAARFDTIVCASSWGQSEFTRLGVSTTVRVPLGVDLETFTPQRRQTGLRAELLSGGDVALVHVGRLAPGKRPDLAVRCLASLRRRGVDARLRVIGDGPLRGELERAAAGLPVAFTGHLADQKALAALLASADLALCPGPVESFGLAALEALACGTPIVASRIGAVAELLFGEASGQVAFSHPGSMTAAVRFPWSATVQRMLELHGGRPATALAR